MMTRREMQEHGLIHMRSRLEDLVFRKKLTDKEANSFCRYCLRQLDCDVSQLTALTEVEFMKEAKKFIVDSSLTRKHLEKLYRDWKKEGRSSRATLRRCHVSSN